MLLEPLKGQQTEQTSQFHLAAGNEHAQACSNH